MDAKNTLEKTNDKNKDESDQPTPIKTVSKLQ